MELRINNRMACQIYCKYYNYSVTRKLPKITLYLTYSTEVRVRWFSFLDHPANIWMNAMITHYTINKVAQKINKTHRRTTKLPTYLTSWHKVQQF